VSPGLGGKFGLQGRSPGRFVPPCHVRDRPGWTTSTPHCAMNI